jgi:hypothetical protein
VSRRVRIRRWTTCTSRDDSQETKSIIHVSYCSATVSCVKTAAKRDDRCPRSVDSEIFTLTAKSVPHLTATTIESKSTRWICRQIAVRNRWTTVHHTVVHHQELRRNFVLNRSVLILFSHTITINLLSIGLEVSNNAMVVDSDSTSKAKDLRIGPLNKLPIHKRLTANNRKNWQRKGYA